MFTNFHRIPRCYSFPVLITLVFFLSGCYDGIDHASSPEKINSKDTFRFRETIAVMNTEVINVSGFKRKNIAEILCQNWELTDPDDASTTKLMFVNGTGDRIYTGISIFRDSSVVINPRGKMKTGTWQLFPQGNDYILNIKTAGELIRFRLYNLHSGSMHVKWEETGDSLWMRLKATGIVHSNEMNDPFHPSNMTWRIKPLKQEPDSILRLRVSNCLKFYALLFRDVIKTGKSSITYGGLPSIFNWYNGGIGLDAVDEISDSWIDCFYNKEDALKAHKMLSDLIVNNEFTWPLGTPGWTYRTHSVLEQMYHRMNIEK